MLSRAGSKLEGIHRPEWLPTHLHMPSSAGSFVPDKACQELAQAFGQSVKQLITSLVRDPKFELITKSN